VTLRATVVFRSSHPDQKIAGGLIANLLGVVLYRFIVRKDELRGCGYGHRLLETAEKEARQRGATN